MRTVYYTPELDYMDSAIEQLLSSENKSICIDCRDIPNILHKTPLEVPDNEAINHFRCQNDFEVIEGFNKKFAKCNLFFRINREDSQLYIEKRQRLVK